MFGGDDTAEEVVGEVDDGGGRARLDGLEFGE